MLRVQSRTSSLLIRLLLGFLTVILLLVSFNYMSFTFFQSNIRNEIIRYNAQNISFTSDRYEEHFQLVQKQMYALYFNDDVSSLKNSTGSARFQLLDRVRQEIIKVVGNPLIYVDNAIVVFQDSTLTLSRTGSNDRITMFEKFYASKSYPDAFWRQQFKEPYASKIFPVSDFYEHAFYQSGEATLKGAFIPYISKHRENEEFYLVALLDANKLFRAFHRSVNANFMIFDEGKQLLYSTGELEDERRGGVYPVLPDGQSYVLHDNTYYFYRVGEHSGFTYLNIVPGSSISQQVSRLNLTLLAMLVLALTVSVVLSVWFSMRFNKPVRQMVSSIQQTGGSERLFKSNIKEFDLIGRKLEDVLKTNARIQLDLMQKNHQLVSYGYLNKLKKIHNGPRNALDPITNRAYRILVYEITYKDRFWEEMKDEPGPLTYCLYEYFQYSLRQVFPTALTLQVERRQMLSVLDEIDDARTEAYIAELLRVLAHDEDYYFLTIAVSPPYPELFDFTEAYEQTTTMLQQRVLVENTQVVRVRTGCKPSAHLFTPAQEQQFDSNLGAGNTSELLHLLDRHLALMERKCATVQQYQDFVVEIVQKVRKALIAGRADEQAIEPALTGLRASESLYSGRHYRRFFSQLLVAACEAIRSNRKEGDPIIDFVVEYVEKHYAEDITLDIVAEPLHITGGYLSTYYKEKTGEYFVDYIHGVRIRESQRMLLETDLRIQDIGLRAGYQNVNSFNRMFKKFSGMSPRDFRKIHLSGNLEQV